MCSLAFIKAVEHVEPTTRICILTTTSLVYIVLLIAIAIK